jgi:hypothetical protein
MCLCTWCDLEIVGAPSLSGGVPFHADCLEHMNSELDSQAEYDPSDEGDCYGWDDGHYDDDPSPYAGY